MVRLRIGRAPLGPINVRCRDDLRVVHPGETVEFKLED